MPMYIHLGGDVSVTDDSVITVISLETASPSHTDLTSFISGEDEENRLQYLTEDIPKSVVVTKERTYMSPMSSSVLRKRLDRVITGLYDFEDQQDK